jgi:uncharacterized Zn ribbon protein
MRVGAGLSDIRLETPTALLAEGDTVTLIKDLKLKGSSTMLKRGNPEHPPHRQ